MGCGLQQVSAGCGNVKKKEIPASFQGEILNHLPLSLDEYNQLVTLCNGTNEGPIQRGVMERENSTLPTMNDVRSCLGIRDFDSPPYFTNSSFSFR